MGSSYVGTPGWGLRRGPNKDGSACIKVNYSCDLDGDREHRELHVRQDVSGQQATFKYLFLWGPRAPQANGWTDYRPLVSWNIATPDTPANASTVARLGPAAGMRQRPVPDAADVADDDTADDSERPAVHGWTRTIRIA